MVLRYRRVRETLSTWLVCDWIVHNSHKSDPSAIGNNWQTWSSHDLLIDSEPFSDGLWESDLIRLKLLRIWHVV